MMNDTIHLDDSVFTCYPSEASSTETEEWDDVELPSAFRGLDPCACCVPPKEDFLNSDNNKAMFCRFLPVARSVNVGMAQKLRQRPRAPLMPLNNKVDQFDMNKVVGSKFSLSGTTKPTRGTEKMESKRGINRSKNEDGSTVPHMRDCGSGKSGSSRLPKSTETSTSNDIISSNQSGKRTEMGLPNSASPNKRALDTSNSDLSAASNADTRGEHSQPSQEVIDLLDSSSDDHSIFTPKRQATQKRTPSARRNVLLSSGDSSDPSSSSNINNRNRHGNSQMRTGTSDCSEVKSLKSRASVTGKLPRTKHASIESIDDLTAMTKKSLRIAVSSDDDSSSVGVEFDSDCFLSSDEDGEDLQRSGKNFEVPKMSRATFQRKREKLSKEAFAEFNREAFGGQLSEVEVTWSSKLRTTAGLTRLKKKTTHMKPGVAQERLASIELSTKVLDDISRLRFTLLHEMVHAAAWIVDGVSRPPHGACFKKWAKIATKAIPDMTVTTTHSYEIRYKYAWACTSTTCNFVVKRHSRSVDLNKHACGKCRSALVEIDAAAETASQMAAPTPKKKRAPSAYNLFVKEHSQSVRKRLLKNQKEKGIAKPQVSQADVMKECGRMWREAKST